MADPIRACSEFLEVDMLTDPGGTLACWLPENHDGPHWDRVDNVNWQAISQADGEARRERRWDRNCRTCGVTHAPPAVTLLQWCQQCQAATTSWIDVWGVVHCTGCDPQD